MSSKYNIYQRTSSEDVKYSLMINYKIKTFTLLSKLDRTSPKNYGIENIKHKGIESKVP
jgi:hypothetical protein